MGEGNGLNFDKGVKGKNLFKNLLTKNRLARKLNRLYLVLSYIFPNFNQLLNYIVLKSYHHKTLIFGTRHAQLRM